MSASKDKSIEDIRKELHAHLVSLTPREVKLLRAQLGLSASTADIDEDDQQLPFKTATDVLADAAKRKGDARLRVSRRKDKEEQELRNLTRQLVALKKKRK